MKKSLFALAALGAIASTAQAQSSVTVYGVIDLGYAGSNTRVANQGATASTNGVTNSTTSWFSDGAESTSRLGFKGNEDLGGGLSAFFTYETKVTPNGSAGLFNGTAGDGTRQAFAGLKKAGVGQFAFGTQYTTIFNAASQSDPGMLNNMGGNVIYDKFSGAAAQTQNSSTGFGTYGLSGQQNNTSFIVRQANMLSFASDTFSGFQGNAYYVLNQNNTNGSTVSTGNSGYAASTGSTNKTAWGLGGNYTWNKLFVTANYQNETNKNPYTVSNTTGLYSAGAPVMGGFGGSVLTGTNDRDNQQYYAATYDFGILKAFVQYVNRKTSDINFSTNYVARTAQQIGVRSFVTPTIESWASVGTGKTTVSTAGAASGTGATNTFVGGQSTIGSNSANFGGFQLGTNYWLSKRTNLYAIYGQQRTSNQNYTLGANPTSYNMNDYAVGLRHTF
ncbi:porin [Polynucleobacter paneuropaeus]|nr:porin [Polynucleobacter paneuropaeus]